MTWDTYPDLRCSALIHVWHQGTATTWFVEGG